MINDWQTEKYVRPAIIFITTCIFAFLSHFNNICLIECIFYIKKMAKSIAVMSAFIGFNRIIAVKNAGCINRGEPAAVFVFPIKIKVVEEIRPGMVYVRLFNNPRPNEPSPHSPGLCERSEQIRSKESNMDENKNASAAGVYLPMLHKGAIPTFRSPHAAMQPLMANDPHTWRLLSRVAQLCNPESSPLFSPESNESVGSRGSI